MKVYVTQEGKFDYSPAEAYGDVVFLTGDELVPIKGSLRNESLIDSLRFQLQKYDPEEDFILPSGSPYVSALVFYILGSKNVGKLRMLRWSNRDKQYTPIFIDLNRGVDHAQ